MSKIVTLEHVLCVIKDPIASCGECGCVQMVVASTGEDKEKAQRK